MRGRLCDEKSALCVGELGLLQGDTSVLPQLQRHHLLAQQGSEAAHQQKFAPDNAAANQSSSVAARRTAQSAAMSSKGVSMSSLSVTASSAAATGAPGFTLPSQPPQGGDSGITAISDGSGMAISTAAEQLVQ